MALAPGEKSRQHMAKGMLAQDTDILREAQHIAGAHLTADATQINTRRVDDSSGSKARTGELGKAVDRMKHPAQKVFSNTLA